MQSITQGSFDKISDNQKPLIYIAAPYSIPNFEFPVSIDLTKSDIKKIKDYRVEVAAAVGAIFVKSGNIVFNPITHSHHMDSYSIPYCSDIPSEHWLAFDTFYLERSDILIYVKDIGWEYSSGMNYEQNIITNRGKPVIPFDPTFLGILPPTVLVDFYSEVKRVSQ